MLRSATLCSAALCYAVLCCAALCYAVLCRTVPRQGMFPAPCKESADCDNSNHLRTKCRCSGMWGPYNLEIVDKVKVPDVPAGDYVVGWRWDCEESAQ